MMVVLLIHDQYLFKLCRLFSVEVGGDVLYSALRDRCCHLFIAFTVNLRVLN